MTVGERIKQARTEAGMTQKELGEAMNVTDHTIAQWEAGRRNPKFENIVLLSYALKVDSRWLANGTENNNSRVRTRMIYSSLNSYGKMCAADILMKYVDRHDTATKFEIGDELMALTQRPECTSEPYPFGKKADATQTGPDAAGGEEAEGCQK